MERPQVMGPPVELMRSPDKSARPRFRARHLTGFGNLIPFSVLFSLVILLLTGFTGCGNSGREGSGNRGASPYGKLSVHELSCEYLEDPGVVDVLQPRFSWINQAPEGVRGERQTAYQVRVASAEDRLARPDLWDSGKRKSDRSLRVVYQGKPLVSRQECWWQVRTWDSRGVPSPWSEPGFWRMGILDPGEWKAQWIGAPWQGESALPRPGGGPDGRPGDFGPPAPLLRKEFTLGKKVKSAVAFVTGLGYFELYVNGTKVGNDVLVPNQTNYGKRPGLANSSINVPDDFSEYRVMYLAYDITDKLVEGENVVGGIIGNGFYNPAKFWAEGYGTPRFLCQLYVTYQDGSGDVILSDRSWKATKGPIRMNMVYWGEKYDAREEKKGWSSPGFDDSDWQEVALREAPYGKLAAHTARPDRVTGVFQPVSIEKRGEGHYFVDFGTEISGWVRLNGVKAEAGHTVQMKFNGNQYSGDNTYIFSGEGPESYAPRFNWFVFSGVEIFNWPGVLAGGQVTAEAVNTQIEPSASFETSSALFNGINRIWRRSQTDNMHGGIASDCPHRERSPYTGDGQITSITVMHNFDARNFYQKWVRDMVDAQIEETGYVPNGAPWQPGCGGGPAWGAAICVIPWHFYVHYGSVDMLETTYSSMKGYLRYMMTWVDEEGIMLSRRKGLNGTELKWFNLGEWAPPGEFIPNEMVHTFYLWYCATITGKSAKVLGLEEEAARYLELAERTRKAFHVRFFDEKEGSYGDAGGNILALKMGVPESRYGRVIEAVRKGLKKTGGHLDTGIIGTRFFFEVLADNGLQPMAYEAMNKRTEPGFGRWLELGSTTTREHWDESGSFNHPMFGGGLAWFYRNLAGMQADPEYPGYKHIVFKPQPVDSLDYVSYFNQTPYGRGGVRWSRREGLLAYDFEVPVSTSATLFIPAADPGRVKETGYAEGDHADGGVEYLRSERDYQVYRVESGQYSFEVRD